MIPSIGWLLLTCLLAGLGYFVGHFAGRSSGAQTRETLNIALAATMQTADELTKPEARLEGRDALEAVWATAEDALQDDALTRAEMRTWAELHQDQVTLHSMNGIASIAIPGRLREALGDPMESNEGAG